MWVVGHQLAFADIRTRDSVREWSDDQLHAAVLERDDAALAEIYDRFGAAVFSIALRVLGDRELAQDVSQEVFLALWRAPQNYRSDRGSLGTWLMSAAHHRAVDSVRREEAVRRRAQRAGAEMELAERQAEQSEPVHESAWLNWQGRAVRAALAELSAPQREALLLAYYGGLTQQEVSERTSVPLGTTKTRTRAALSKMREILDSAAVTDLASRRRSLS
jgi:RNA polymerase sigma factor (sigma-70 family)